MNIKKNKKNKKTMVATTQELLWKKEVKKKNVPKFQVKSLKTPLKELISWSSSTL